MDKTVIVKTNDMGEIQCTYCASNGIAGAEKINRSLETMRQLLEATYPRNQIGEIDYELYLYESDEINAFSMETEEGYVIAFSTAIFIEFYKILKNLFLVEEICKWFGTSRAESASCINAIYDYMLWFIAFHEFFHVINGHCGCMTARGIFNAETVTEKNFEDNLNGQIIESDADYCAVIACVNLIFVQAKNAGMFDENITINRLQSMMEEVKQEMIFLGFAIYHTFLLFSCNEKESNSKSIDELLRYDHPYASIRMAYTFMAMTYQLTYFLSMDTVKDWINKVAEICIAYDRIYYAKEMFDKSLLSLAFTERGVQHIMFLHNGWNDIVDELKEHAHIALAKKEKIEELYYWVNEDGTMMFK